MNWIKLIDGEAFKEWLIGTGSGSKLPQGTNRLDPFGSSLRKFNNAHTWLVALDSTGEFTPTGRKAQGVTDLSAAGILDRSSENFTTLGRASFDKWQHYGIPAGNDDFEIHRCLLLVYEAFKHPDNEYGTYFKRWLKLRQTFSFEFLLTNRNYLYLFSYLDKTHGDYNPYDIIQKLDLNESNFDDDIDWTSISDFYNDPPTTIAVTKYSDTIDISREGRSNICIAYELLSNGGIYRDGVTSYLDWSDEKLEILNAILDDITVELSIDQIIFYGAPGTGKSHKVNELIKDKLKRTERITFHPEYDYASFVGGYRPTMDGPDIKYEFVPQVFTNIYTRAWNDLSNDYYLVIEEINRGNCAEIFGDIFQLLDRSNNYHVSPSKELSEYLLDKFDSNSFIDNTKLLLPPNLSILATMNTSDQSLFPMDSAFKRRWNWEYIPINYDESPDNESSEYNVILDGSEQFSWIKFIKAVNELIKTNDNLGMDKCIGNYFIKPDATEINLHTFINKAVFYLWNDVFKDETEEYSIFKNKITYEDFFPIESKGIARVKKILETLEVEINPITT